MLRHVHSEEQNRNQTEIEHRHYPPVRWCDFEVTLFFLGSSAEQRIDPWQREENNQPDKEVWIFPTKPYDQCKPRQPQPQRQRSQDLSTGEHYHRHEIEKAYKRYQPC